MPAWSASDSGSGSSEYYNRSSFEIAYYKCRWRFYLHVIIVVILFIRVLTDCPKSATSRFVKSRGRKKLTAAENGLY